MSASAPASGLGPVDLLRKVPILAEVDEETLAELYARARRRSYAAAKHHRERARAGRRRLRPRRRRGRGLGRPDPRRRGRSLGTLGPGSGVRRDVVAHRRAPLRDGHRRTDVEALVVIADADSTASASAGRRWRCACAPARRAPRRRGERHRGPARAPRPRTRRRTAISRPCGARCGAPGRSSSSAPARSGVPHAGGFVVTLLAVRLRLRLLPLRRRAARRPSRRVHDGVRALLGSSAVALLTFQPLRAGRRPMPSQRGRHHPLHRSR